MHDRNSKKQTLFSEDSTLNGQISAEFWRKTLKILAQLNSVMETQNSNPDRRTLIYTADKCNVESKMFGIVCVYVTVHVTDVQYIYTLDKYNALSIFTA